MRKPPNASTLVGAIRTCDRRPIGSWSPASAAKLDPTSYPTWTGTIDLLPPSRDIEWKCIKRQEANYPATADQWQPGANNTFTTVATGSSGGTTGAF